MLFPGTHQLKAPAGGDARGHNIASDIRQAFCGEPGGPPASGTVGELASLAGWDARGHNHPLLLVNSGFPASWPSSFLASKLSSF